MNPHEQSQFRRGRWLGFIGGILLGSVTTMGIMVHNGWLPPSRCIQPMTPNG